MDPCAFDKLFTKSVPHILEKIFLSLDYKSFKTCLDVSKTWRDLLNSDSFSAKVRLVFHNELVGEEKKLRAMLREVIHPLAYRYLPLRALLQVRNLDPQNLSEILVKIITKT